MTERHELRWGGFAGLGFLVLAIVGAILPGVPPRVTATSDSITSYVADGRDQMLLLAGKPGRTTLIVWRSGGKRQSHSVVVRHGTLDQTVVEIRALLGAREGIVVRTVGDRIFLEGSEITAKGTDVSSVRQRIGIVFQQFNLFPHLKAMDNVTLAARRGVDAGTLQDSDVIPERCGLDSVAILELIMWFEATFDVTVSQADLTMENFGTIDAMASYLDGARRSAD